MTGWLTLTDEQRRETLTQAGGLSSINAKAIEKDWWVTLTLKALFQSAYAPHLVFKGGTSLSKCWKLISRFSEDIDIALAPEAFGMAYEENPTKGHVERIRRKGCAFTSTTLLAELSNQFIALGVPAGALSIEADPVSEKMPDKDPQTLHVRYRSLYDPNPYIADEVKIEVSAKSLKTPYTVRPVLSILTEFFPNAAYAETPFDVQVVEPRKTFLEKAFLLHEEFGKPDIARIRHERMSRHFYDLVNLMNAAAGRQGLEDHDLYDHLVAHRQSYSRISWVDYSTLKHVSITFLPPAAVLEAYRADYEIMQENMIHEETPPAFDYLIEQLKILRGRFRLKQEPRPLEEIIERAIAQLQGTEGDQLATTVVYTSDPARLAEGNNVTVNYRVDSSGSGTGWYLKTSP